MFKGLATKHTTMKWTIVNFAYMRSSLAIAYVEFIINSAKVTEKS